MDSLWIQAGRFWWWFQQGGNSTIVLSVLTALYVCLTYRIMKATARQARASLQPALSIGKLLKTTEQRTSTLLIENLGSQAVVFLDVTVNCFPWGKNPIVRRFELWDDTVLGAGKHRQLYYDFSEELNAIHCPPEACSCQALIVVSDLSHQVGGQYEYLPGSGCLTFRLGIPRRFRLRYMVRPWVWRYERIKGRFTKR